MAMSGRSAATSVEQLRETLVPLGDGKTIRLGDLGTVEDKWSEPRRIARYDGQEAVTFNFLRSRSASEVTVSARVRDEVEKIDEAHPELTIEEVTSSVKYIGWAPCSRSSSCSSSCATGARP